MPVFLPRRRRLACGYYAIGGSPISRVAKRMLIGRYDKAKTQRGAPENALERFCRRCGYLLIGLPENRCPECGDPFDPDDERSFACDEPRSKPLASGKWFIVPMFSGIAVHLVTLWILFAQSVDVNRPFADQVWQVFVFSFLFAVMGAIFGIVAIEAKRYRYRRPVRIAVWCTAIALACWFAYYELMTYLM